MKTSFNPRQLFSACVALPFMFSVAACDNRNDDTAIERQQVENSADAAARNASEAAENAGEAAESAARAGGNAAERAGDELEEAGNAVERETRQLGDDAATTTTTNTMTPYNPTAPDARPGVDPATPAGQ